MDFLAIKVKDMEGFGYEGRSIIKHSIVEK